MSDVCTEASVGTGVGYSAFPVILLITESVKMIKFPSIARAKDRDTLAKAIRFYFPFYLVMRLKTTEPVEEPGWLVGIVNGSRRAPPGGNPPGDSFSRRSCSY